MQTIGEKIKVLRREAGLSQQQLADKLGLSNQAISTNGKPIPIDILSILIVYLGISVSMR